jgi:ketosteroid isomerase-like protein
MDSQKENHKKMVENYIAAYNGMDGEGMVKDLSENVVFENIARNKVTMRLEGKAAFKAQVETALSYFSERKQTIRSWEFGDESLYVDIDYWAILAVDFPNGPKAGEQLRMRGRSEFSFENGKIKRIRDLS